MCVLACLFERVVCVAVSVEGLLTKWLEVVVILKVVPATFLLVVF